MVEVSKRKTKQVISSFFVLLYFCSLPAQAQYGGGTGEPNDPYLIYTAEQMNEIGSKPGDWHKHFKLMTDIDLGIYTGTDFSIIGGSDFPFTGVFDGNGHTISNFSCFSTQTEQIGLFGFVDDPNAQIINLGLVNPDIEAGTGEIVGSLVGCLKIGRIVGCYAEDGSVSGNGTIGGLVGYNTGTVDGCYSTCNVTGKSVVGGLVGQNGDIGSYDGWSLIMISGTISNCYSTGSTSGNAYVGGLVGFYYVGIITNCYATGKVLGNKNVGGLVGTVFIELVEACFWDIETSGQTTSAGGIGKTSAEMQTASTFLDAGWDFADETANGAEDIWWINEGQDYPRLWWQYGKTFSPYPQDGAVDVPQPLTLSWFPGGSGLYHDIYFGEDEETVTSATTESSEIYRGRQESEINIYDPGTLKLEKTYYWRIDEVNDADPNSLPKGNVWSFTTSNFIVVDDFEDYDSDQNFIWYSWKDGLGYAIGPGGSWPIMSNYTGSAVGDEITPSYTEETIVHGGKQSMPYWYDNNRVGYAKYSEAEKWLDYPRDWTKEGVSELSLWFHGRNDFVGSFVEEPVGVFTINSSGTDIGDGRDQFHFAYKSLTGPGSIVARIESIKRTHEWAKVGVMIRQSLHEISQYAFVCVTPGNGVAFQVREEGPETSFTINQTGMKTPHWVKLERDAAGCFTASHSFDGTTWQPVQNASPTNILMPSNVYIGLALTAHNSNATSQGVFSNVTITGTVSEQWEHQDIGIVINDPEPMYVAISNNAGPTAVVVHPDSVATQITTWTEWVIPLQVFTDQGIDLTDVDRIAIGFGTRGNMTIPGGRGKMYFDDIRLYRPRSTESNELEDNVP